MEASAAVRATGIPTRAIASALLWFAVFLGGFVFYEPAPYELFLALLIPAWMMFGTPIPRSLGPLLVLMILFIAGGVLAITQAKIIDVEPMYIAVTGFLALSSCFFACVIAEDRTRLDVIVGAWIVAALATTALGIIGYAGLTGELFTLYSRAAGGFQDPNVFGPFLVFPFTILAQRLLLRPPRFGLLYAVSAAVLLIGIFLSGSRAAWGLAAFSLGAMGVLLFINERSPTVRARYIALAVVGIVAAVALVAIALSIPSIGGLMAERAKLEQDYDVGHLGRFARHAIGFNMMLDHPLGIGAMEFGQIFTEDEHDIWLKALTTYGWLGFAAYLTLVIWTVAAAAPALFRTGPLQHVAQVALVVFVGHILAATVIDIDHWRHVFLLFGILWGIIVLHRRSMPARRPVAAATARR